MKLISWNVNGIRACVQKGFLEFFREADADIFCIQESKMQAGQLDLELEGYHYKDDATAFNGLKKGTIVGTIWHRDRGA